PEWRFHESIGHLRLAQGKLREAHENFRLALELARNFRVAVPASDATRVSLEGFLQQIYGSFVETGARLYFEGDGAELVGETFEALEENRAGSLTARLGETRHLRAALPTAYWEQLDQLRQAESIALRSGGEGGLGKMRRIRSSMIEMEIGAGASW